MSDPDTEDEFTEGELGGLSIEDDPEGTIDPAELAGSGSEDSDEPLPDYSEDDLED